MKDRMSWKLDQAQTTPSYYRAVIDEETFTFAIAADYYAFCAMTNSPCPSDVLDILDWAERVFSSQMVDTQAGGVLLQPGVWAEHRDYA